MAPIDTAFIEKPTARDDASWDLDAPWILDPPSRLSFPPRETPAAAASCCGFAPP